MNIVEDLDRPDKGNTPPKMQAIAQTTKEALANLTPFLSVKTDDNLMSSVVITGTFQPREQWPMGIFHNARYFIFFIRPARGQRYYTAGEPVEVELTSCNNLPKFRKSTTTPEKAIQRIKTYLGTINNAM